LEKSHSILNKTFTLYIQSCSALIVIFIGYCSAIIIMKHTLYLNAEEEQEETFVADFGRSGGESPSTSWVELPRPEGVGRSLSIEVWFLARKADGLLLYAAQLPPAPHPPAPPSVSAASAQSPLSSPTIRRSDFVALNLVSGHLQFLFDLGSGIANIT
jgi:hypothetical protein